MVFFDMAVQPTLPGCFVTALWTIQGDIPVLFPSVPEQVRLVGKSLVTIVALVHSVTDISSL